MNNHHAELDLLIRKSKDKGELVPSTVRLPVTLHAEVEELAEDLGISRQAMLVILIGVGAKAARAKADTPSEMTGKFHVLNTNRRNSDMDEYWMLKNEAAAAFYSPWKEQIDKIQKGDVVFLYSSGVGIIAYGIASGERQVGDTLDPHHVSGIGAGERYFQTLTDFKKLQTPLSAQDIKTTLGRNVAFLQTRFPLPDGEKLLQKVKRMRIELDV